ncbi:MAG: hypothetical protein ACOYN0_17130, partial [Phycisphaerales bacterium]
MKIRMISAALGLALSASAFAQPLQTHRAIGTTGYEVAYEIQHTTDGGYVTVGRIGASPTVLPDIHVVKYDRFGNPTWSRRYGSVNQAPDIGHSIQQTPDGGYVIGFESTTVSNRQ